MNCLGHNENKIRRVLKIKINSVNFYSFDRKNNLITIINAAKKKGKRNSFFFRYLVRVAEGRNVLLLHTCNCTFLVVFLTLIYLGL